MIECGVAEALAPREFLQVIGNHIRVCRSLGSMDFGLGPSPHGIRPIGADPRHWADEVKRMVHGSVNVRHARPIPKLAACRPPVGPYYGSLSYPMLDYWE